MVPCVVPTLSPLSDSSPLDSQPKTCFPTVWYFPTKTSHYFIYINRESNKLLQCHPNSVIAATNCRKSKHAKSLGSFHVQTHFRPHLDLLYFGSCRYVLNRHDFSGFKLIVIYCIVAGQIIISADLSILENDASKSLANAHNEGSTSIIEPSKTSSVTLIIIAPLARPLTPT